MVRTLGGFCLSALLALTSQHALAQSEANLAALRGLAPVSVLLNTAEGNAALRANLVITGGIQTGILKQPLLVTFPEQQRLALRDCFITDGNASQLADGLGTRLGDAYRARAKYENAKDFTSVSKALADLIGYTNDVTKSNSNAGKFFFGNATLDGKQPVSPETARLMTAIRGTTDVFGKAYDLPIGSPGASLYGNSRPFLTEPSLLAYRDDDFFGEASRSLDWLQGPGMDLRNSPSFPSGHTTYGYTEGLLLAILVPDRYQQMVVRAAEYGNNRILVGAHYAMDVIGGRAVASHALAHLLANHPDYVGPTRKNPAVIDGAGREVGEAIVIDDYQAALKAARTDLQRFLAERCGDVVSTCAADDSSRFRDWAANQAFYDITQTYDLPAVYPERAYGSADVGKLAPEAGHLLTAAFPFLSLDEANAILTETLGPGGGFLDDGSSVLGIYARLNLYAAAGKAADLGIKKRSSNRINR